MELHIKVIEATNIPKADVSGKNDCFVTVSTLRTKQSLMKTKILKNTEHPVWNEEFTLKIDYVSDTIVVALFDHDSVSADDSLGVLHFRAHDLNPGLVENRKWTMVGMKKGQNPDIQLQTQIVYTYMKQPKWTPVNMCFIDCFVRIVEGTQIPKMDGAGKSDPFIKLTISTDDQQWSHTAVQDNTLEPKWNESFLFWVTNPLEDKLMFKLWDQDISSDDLISTLELPLSNFKVGQAVEQYFDFTPNKKNKAGGKIKMYILLQPKGAPMPSYGRLLPQLTAPDKFTAVGMPENGYPPQPRM